MKNDGLMGSGKNIGRNYLNDVKQSMNAINASLPIITNALAGVLDKELALRWVQFLLMKGIHETQQAHEETD
jgi:hypothetical protein